jgi:hypothetical protein
LDERRAHEFLVWLTASHSAEISPGHLKRNHRDPGPFV